MWNTPDPAKVRLVAKVLREVHRRKLVPLWTEEGELPYCAGGSAAGQNGSQAIFLLQTLTGFPSFATFIGAVFPHSQELDDLFSTYQSQIPDLQTLPELTKSQLQKLDELERYLEEGLATDSDWTRLLTAYAYHARKRPFRPSGARHSSRKAEFHKALDKLYGTDDRHRFSPAQVDAGEAFMQEWEQAHPASAAPSARQRPLPVEFHPIVEHRSRLSSLAAPERLLG
jgi:hypothetical protein